MWEEEGGGRRRRRTHVLTGSGEWLVEEHETDLAGELGGEGFLKVMDGRGRG